MVQWSLTYPEVTYSASSHIWNIAEKKEGSKKCPYAVKKYCEIPKSKLMHLFIKEALTLLDTIITTQVIYFPNHSKSERRYKMGVEDSKFKHNDSNRK